MRRSAKRLATVALTYGVSLSVIDIGFSAITWSVWHLTFELSVRGALILAAVSLAFAALIVLAVYGVFLAVLWRQTARWYQASLEWPPETDYLGERPTYVRKDSATEKRVLSPKPVAWHAGVSILSIGCSVFSFTLVQVETSLPLWATLGLCNAPLALARASLVSSPQRIARLKREAEEAEQQADQDHYDEATRQRENFSELMHSIWF